MTYNIEVNNLSLKYKNFEALKDVSFKLEDGKIYGLLGRNGAGKTSLLSILASYRQQTAGSVKIAGAAPYENAEINQNISFHFQTNYEEETEKVKNMLSMVEEYRPNYDAEYAKYLVELFKLPMNKNVNKLSKGMQSALEVIMGLASRSPITIFDESYLSMDAPTRVKFYNELLKDQENHPRIFILSTHLVSEMDYLFDEVLILDNGKLLLHEDYETLISRGMSITGNATDVDEFVKGRRILSSQQLGKTKSVMIYEERTEKIENAADSLGLEIGPISLQDLFIHLTETEDSHESK
ncbi:MULTISPECIES: ATP-binding cassette domain-containing protein [Sedimentibacter]|uniref:ABC transporter ATP-binding protein n=1 Tax=Sedimentibacter hydroxybenzoicus DSM 7310 TaxID=1123245 RepID=A0A974BJD8_SEDHY|nr:MULTISPECIES: ABC transporter ATP-binding protein [Sedimentibacter]NYB73730.1 ABC transporter ATP-binding protein [Sedimentibacter hydroxybenzoicus DSM 7310]